MEKSKKKSKRNTKRELEDPDISGEIPEAPSFHEFETFEASESSPLAVEDEVTEAPPILTLPVMPARADADGGTDAEQNPEHRTDQVGCSKLDSDEVKEVGFGPEVHSSDVVQNEEEDVDPCEEALSILASASAPVNFESGDFYSLPRVQKSIEHLESVEEEVDVFKAEAKPSHRSQIKALYNNYLLENNASCVNHFLDSLQPACDGFELFELLSNYLRACNHLTGCEKSLSALKDACDDLEKRVWTLNVKQLTQNTTCEDGVTLTASYKVHEAQFNQPTFPQLTRTLKDIKELLKDSFSLHTYSVQLSRTQIEHFLFKFFGNFNLESFQIQNYTPGYPTQDVRVSAALLKRTITVIFHFLRKPLLHSSFTKDCQDWVSRCTGLLLRIATIEDHIFLLNHVVRLPPRVVAKFGAPLVQVPPIPIPTNPSEYSASFTHLHLDYALTFLATILSPVPKRTELLSQYQIALKTAVTSPDASLQWVLVDSDGEDDGADENLLFKEVDLIALLHQVPFDKIFRRVMLIYTDEGEDVFDLKVCSEHSVLKLLAFGSQLITILGYGLVTYYTDQYRQLMKLIGRLILHTIQYVSDQVEHFIEAGGRTYGGATPVFGEYDIFLFEAVSVLMTGKNVGMGQFLASVPYHLISTGMLWEVYALLTKWDSSASEDVSSEFEHELMSMNESNAFYTLTTMSNMALARDGKENQFVKVVTFHLFQIGFLSPITRDACSKNVRDLLGSLSRYPRVISHLLQNIKQKMDVLDKLALFMVRELAFDQWNPSGADLQLLSHWMLNFHTFSLENQVARFVLQSMNWDFGEFDQLFLPVEIHYLVALLVVESHFKWERPQNVISESVKQLSAWVTRNPDFSSWTWDIIKRLHLHGFDRHVSSPPSISSLISELPAFDSNVELGVLKKAVDEKNPVACAVTLLLTPIGHSLPLICTQGFELIEVLLQNSKFEAVINLLFFLVPLFCGSRESIVTCEKFRNILTTLLAADMTYVRMAKSLIPGSEFPGIFTKMFGEMIHTQLYQHLVFGTTKGRLILLWLDLLTKIQGWNKDNNILCLLEVIAKFSFSDEDCNGIFHEYFNAMYKEMPLQNSSGIASFLFNWSYSATTVLPNATYPQMPYFTYFILTIESSLENESGFWKSLSKSLTNPKTTLEAAVKKACGTSKYSTTTNYLTIYRWAQHCLELPFSHPLLLIFWQKFFVKYFHRSIASDNGGGIGERFFEGMINTAFLKRLKKRLHDTLQFYTTEINKLENENGGNEGNHGENTGYLLDRLKKCSTLVNGMTLWIEDSRYHQDTLYIPALPLQCLPVRLHTLMDGDTTDWTEYIDLDEIQLSGKTTMQNYLSLIIRLCWMHPRGLPKPSNWTSTLMDRREELLKRLDSYDAPLDPPPVPTFPQILPNITTPMLTDLEAMESGLKIHFTRLLTFAEQFSLQISKHTALDCTYWDNLPDLYTISESEALVNVECKKFSRCAGPGHAIFKFSEARLNERVGHIIHQNRTDYHNLISQSLIQPPPLPMSVAAVFIEDFITNLILLHRNMLPNSEELGKVERIGTELFYLLVNGVNEDTNFYPPTRQLFSSFLEVLGHAFIESDPTQSQRLVSMCINRPQLVGTLTPHMKLLATSADMLIRIYEDVINIPDRNGDLAFVILSKLDLRGWLRKRKPRLVERSKLITLMWKAVAGDIPNPEGRNPMVIGTYRKHLKTMLLHDFPQHYGEILNLLLDDSEKNFVPLELWYDFCNALSRDTVRFSKEMDPFLRKRELKRFSMEVDMLRHQELVETVVLLGNHFKKERLSYGIYGLYPKYRFYVEPLSCFFQMISYALISSSLKNSNGSPSIQIVEAVWPFLRDLYNPWILPYSQRTVQQDCAQWIQQMNFDSASVLSPWIATDSNFAALFMSDFTDSVLFLAETLPGCPALFSHLWNFYAENYAHPTVKDHVLHVVNNCYISIPWALFWPTMADMELMNRIVEKYLPACHNLMGVIFAQINWREWVLQVNGCTTSIKNKCYAILLNLSVHLATDIVARESPTWTSVMQIVQSLNWEFILPPSLEPVLNWFVMSIDPRVVLGLDFIHHLDKASFQLLKIASGFGASPEEIQSQPRRAPTGTVKADLNRKRYLFVRTYTRLLVSASTKYKNLLQTNAQNFEKSLQNILDDISVPVREENQQRSEFGAHLKEVIGLITNHYLGTITRNAAIAWLETNKDAPLPFIYEILQITFSMKVPPYITVPLVETGIPLVFRHPDGNWQSIGHLAVITEQSEQNQYLDVASKDGHFLVLYCLLVKRIHFYTHGALQSVSSLMEIMKNIKPRESNETALPLLYRFFFKVSIALLDEGAKHLGGHLEKAVKKFLSTFSLHLTSVGDDKQGWVLLGVLGLTKASLLTVRGRLFARCLSVFLMAQLPVNAPIRLEVKEGDPVATTKTEPKPHGELESSLQKLEELKANRQYSELLDCIDSSLNFIRDPSHTLSSYQEFIRLLIAQLFTEPYLLQEAEF